MHFISDIENIKYPYYFKHDFSNGNQKYCIYGQATSKDVVHYIKERDSCKYGHFTYEITESTNDYSYVSNMYSSSKHEYESVKLRVEKYLKRFKAVTTLESRVS